MMKAILICGGFVWAGLSACATVETRLPMPSASVLAAETNAQETEAFQRYSIMLARLDAVSSKVLEDNAPLCKKTQLDVGALIHMQKDYPKDLRASAARRLGAQATPSVLSVRPRSRAFRAGLRKGDVFLGKTGKPVRPSDSYIQSRLQAGEPLEILRGEKTLNLQLMPHRACAYAVRLKFSGAVNAYATGKSIIVTTAMMDFAKTDEQLALVVGHELAHNTMGHVRKIVMNRVLSGGARRTTRPFEAEADYVGLYYMARAGFSLDGVENFWRRLGVLNPKSIAKAKSHPITPSRLVSIRMAAQEIETKQKEKIALTPNYLKNDPNEY